LRAEALPRQGGFATNRGRRAVALKLAFDLAFEKLVFLAYKVPDRRGSLQASNCLFVNRSNYFASIP